MPCPYAGTFPRITHGRGDARLTGAAPVAPPSRRRDSPLVPALPPTRSVAEAAAALRDLADRWRTSTLGEKQAFQTWFLEFCDALGVEKPGPDFGDDYCFEKTVRVLNDRGDGTPNFIDCWKAGHVAVEAKAGASDQNDVLVRKAFKQVSQYVAAEPGAIPPYLMVVDVPRELIVWDRWSGRFGDFPAGHRIPLATLADRPRDIELLHDILTRPHVRDPRSKAQQVTKEIAGKLAQLASVLENRGHDAEQVARFLMRCVFCCFAEDVGLLPKDLFKRTLESARQAGGPERVGSVLTKLWTTMDTGGDFGAELIAKFNGHFFKTVESLPLQEGDIDLLVEAAGFTWADVEPSIFGTLLVRALSPEERHKLGAEYTPREYIERLVEPTVVEPIRERWSAVQARVVQLESEDVGATPRVARGGRSPKPSKARREAIAEVQGFHAWLRKLRFLDPACGSGNFLYVTMAAVKEIELEVLTELARLSGGQGGLVLEEVHPRQFHGIEINWWAREIAELTLWIGYHQFWRRAHGGRTPPVPILEDTETIECRDAILAWDAIVHRPEKDRLDPTPRIPNPVTGDLMPDPDAKLPYMEYVNPRPAEWPVADFIVGNPPYLGQGRMRDALGDGYVDALRNTYPSLSPSIDLVMYWWYRASGAVSTRTTQRAGLITTSSLTQPQNRSVIQDFSEGGGLVRWTIPSHPWIDEAGGADVRVAMSVLGGHTGLATRIEVDDDGQVVRQEVAAQLNADLTRHADVAGASHTTLAANEGLSHDGVKLHGAGFLLGPGEHSLLGRSESVVRPYLNGRDVAAKNRWLRVIDFGLMDERDASQYPVSFDLVRSRVKPQRDSNRRDTYRTYWWRFGEPRRHLRTAIEGLSRYIVTVDTARHRYFLFVPSEVVVDDKLVAIASDIGAVLGYLSSGIHTAWALAAGGRLGVGNDPVYTKTQTFDPFPFPDPVPELRERIGALAERLDQHRKDAIARDEIVTMTGMYNVVEKLRSNTPLAPKERRIHEIAACGVLRDLHDELDALVAEAYGWPWPMEREEILERLVALHDERVEEEQRGHIRWLRPEYQIPRFAPQGTPTARPLDDGEAEGAGPGEATKLPWPATAVEQLQAIAAVAARGPATLEAVVAGFDGADRKLVARHLETLVMLGEV